MKVVILAGGYGTRISEESHLKPKPMIEIGGKPILWHIMKIYSRYGFNDFIICLGYKGYVIKEYFAHYFLHESDVTFDFTQSNKQIIHHAHAEPWKVTLVNTGLETMTGGRLKKVREYLGDEPFMFTYGDGVADVNLNKLVELHKSHGKLATVTSVQPSGRFGALALGEHGEVHGFQEKPKGDGGWINGGFFVLQPEIIDYISGDSTIFEQDPLVNLAKDGQLYTYKHTGFWQPMDTLRDKNYLEEMWNHNKAPWKIWE
ncbi:glucose-1-phosphate cytidylyltransferase [Lysinibacillus pakistanensis]|uniref:glucose-1-phosphate cytidylyltransferase n=1 Tax=Lysinibacillus pakistanensis TaxID=759811 RepID=UPI003D2E1FE1